MLIFEVDGTFMCLFSSLGFSFRREGLDLEGLSLGERKFDLRESLGERRGRSPW